MLRRSDKYTVQGHAMTEMSRSTSRLRCLMYRLATAKRGILPKKLTHRVKDLWASIHDENWINWKELLCSLHLYKYIFNCESIKTKNAALLKDKLKGTHL